MTLNDRSNLIDVLNALNSHGSKCIENSENISQIKLEKELKIACIDSK